ncbi:DUF4102 domain-containing protein [Bartonella massiliensis]|uniref:DUF4102 domain-containing protein n=1 Tax=Bartonella massiliensis TaxID=929795 RepID=UPI001FE3231C|nr:DUF4102 domain-containing protein [Bartonella massiliensis]
MQSLLQHSKAGKVYDGAGLLLHKRKDGNAQWILYYFRRLYHYTIHGHRREMDVTYILRDVSLKKLVN